MKARRSGDWSLVEAAHLLNRAGFGGGPDAIRAFHGLGMEAAVEGLVHPTGPWKAPEPPSWANVESHRSMVRELMEARREGLRAGAAGAGPLARRGAKPATAGKDKAGEGAEMGEMVPDGGAMREADRDTEVQKVRNQQQVAKLVRERGVAQGLELTRWWLGRMIRGEDPLREKITLFWHGHFASGMDKVRSAYFMFLQNALFREKGLGHFGTLTKAVVRDPAMMVYLDLQQVRKQKPNENFAREVMELFLLGEGNYSENDVKEAARAFTGLRLDRTNGTTSFARFQHDGGSKTLFGKTGNFGPDEVVDLLLAQPACPRFLARKLWRYFVNDAPAGEDVEALARVITEEKYEIGAVLGRLFRSERFYHAGNIRAEIKSPVVFFVQLARQLEMKSLPEPVVASGMREMGQILFLPPNVAGWPGGASWITTNSLFARYNAAGKVVRSGDPRFEVAGGAKAGKFKDKPVAGAVAKRVRERVLASWPKPDFARLAPAELRSDPQRLVDQFLFRFFQHPMRLEDRESFLSQAKDLAAGGLSDEEIGQLIHLMLSTPAYQLT